MVLALKRSDTEIPKMHRALRPTCSLMPSYMAEEREVGGPTCWWEAAA